ncbi:MAG: aminoacyl-tRNA hydrolase [Planctomycetota bacterium]
MGRERDIESPELLVVGLGNPGEDYRLTRHNIGFDVLDRLAETLGIRFSRLTREEGFSGRVKARVAHGAMPFAGPGSTDGEPPKCRSFVLVKPWTYVNLSGAAVAALAGRYEIQPESIFVILDDLNLPLGRLRIRPGGGPGGHNGMKSILSCLGTEGFPRLRMGIGVPGVSSSEMADFVLDRFHPGEEELLKPLIRVSVDATRCWLEGESIEPLMSRFNSFDAARIQRDDTGT